MHCAGTSVESWPLRFVLRPGWPKPREWNWSLQRDKKAWTKLRGITLCHQYKHLLHWSAIKHASWGAQKKQWKYWALPHFTSWQLFSDRKNPADSCSNNIDVVFAKVLRLSFFLKKCWIWFSRTTGKGVAKKTKYLNSADATLAPRLTYYTYIVLICHNYIAVSWHLWPCPILHCDCLTHEKIRMLKWLIFRCTSISCFQVVSK